MEINMLLVGVIAGLLVAMSLVGRPQVIVQQVEPEQREARGGCGLGLALFVALVVVVAFFGVESAAGPVMMVF